MTTLTLYKDNDCVLEHLVREVVSDADIQSATVTYDLQDNAGDSVDDGGMTYITTETIEGETYYKFRSTIADTVSVVAGSDYTVVIDVDGGSGLKGHWEYSVIAQTRDS